MDISLSNGRNEVVCFSHSNDAEKDNFPERDGALNLTSFSPTLTLRIRNTEHGFEFAKGFGRLILRCPCAGPPCVADTTADLRNVFTFMPSPEYPRRYHIEGTVLLRVSLDAQGAVTGVQILKSSGDKTLDFASTEALRHWRARPGRPGRFFDIPTNFTRYRNSPAAPERFDGLGAARSSDAGKAAGKGC
jgi:protein TonB